MEKNELKIRYRLEDGNAYPILEHAIKHLLWDFGFKLTGESVGDEFTLEFTKEEKGLSKKELLTELASWHHRHLRFLLKIPFAVCSPQWSQSKQAYKQILKLINDSEEK